MVVSSVSIGRDKLEIWVAFSNGVFDIATVYDGHVCSGYRRRDVPTLWPPASALSRELRV